MAQSRLTTALDEGLLTLPEGPVVVFRPPAHHDLSALPAGELTILQGFRPDADFWSAAGFAVTPEPGDGRAAAAVVVVPRSKALARSLVAQAAARAGLVIVDGQKTDGVDSLFRDLRGRVDEVATLTKAHGRLFWFVPPAGGLADWAAAPPAPGPEGFFTQAGVFSEAGIDRGSALLAEALPRKLPARVADLGAGWGFLARAVLAREGVVAVDLIEAEALALDCARLNVTDPRAAFHWADATRFAPAKAYDMVVSNPPFHAGRAPDAALGQAFVAAAARMLTPQGHLWMVANRHLPYEATLREKFRTVEDAGGDAAFKIVHATRPKR